MGSFPETYDPGVLPYINYTGMCPPPPHRVGFLRRFGLETGMVFEGTTGVYERIYRCNSK